MATLSGPLVSAGWLAGHLGDVLVADCRWDLDDPTAGLASYGRAHIPGAIYVSLDDHLSDMTLTDAGRHPLPSRRRFARTLGGLGIDNATTVVAYDDIGGGYASRLWWMMRWMGHAAVAVLDGGLQRWEDETRSISTEPTTLASTAFVIGTATMPTVDRVGVAARHPCIALVDARAADRYRGDREPVDPAAGHVPGAISAPFAGNLVGGVFLSPQSLRDRYAALGIEHGQSTIVYCGSGVTACHDILAIEEAGLGTAMLYPGSWSDWSTSGGTVATGD